MKREHWSSKLGFILAVAGSAIGLANIWRFPYITGTYGGAAFVILYLLCLLAIGFPVFISEIAIGRHTQANPAKAFAQLGGKYWGWLGKMSILTGFLVSAFYSAIAGWILGYFFEAIQGSLVQFKGSEEAATHYSQLLSSPGWGIGFHALFLISCIAVLFFGVKKGIEKCNKFFMPLLFIILFALVGWGLFLPNSLESIRFLFQPDWSVLTPTALLVALGQSFFTLSIGQGTLVTYGSYLEKSESILSSSVPVVLMDTWVSILSALAVFTIVFSVGIAPDQGEGLLFNTLPIVFSQIPGGYIISILFFLLVVLAALTSEISALEPSIAYLTDQWKWKRSTAVLIVGLGAFLLGIPCSLSMNILKEWYLFGTTTFLHAMIYLCSNILIPLGGLAAVLLVGRKWGVTKFFEEMNLGTANSFQKDHFTQKYLHFCIRYLSPLLIIIVFLSAIGMLA